MTFTVKTATSLQPPDGVKDLRVDGVLRQGQHGEDLQEVHEEAADGDFF
jgi:hypothetical protein